MKLTKKQYESYWKNGWLVVNSVFSEAITVDIADLATTIATNEMDITNNYSADQSTNGEVAPRKIMQPFKKSQKFRDFVLDPKLRSLIQQILKKTPVLAQDQIFMKPPNFGSAKPYHQDNAYFKCEPGDDVITAWIALDDVNSENGCLRYIDGSHKEPILEHKPIPDETYNLAPDKSEIDLSKESLGVVKKGGVIFHHGATLHTSHRNESLRWRRAYATHWVTPTTTCEIKTLNNALFKEFPEYFFAGSGPCTQK